MAPPRPSSPVAGGGPPGLAASPAPPGPAAPGAAASLVIDLGLRPPAADGPAPDAPAGPALPPGAARRWAGVLVALVAVLVVPAAQPLPPPRLELLYRLGHIGQALAIGEESLYELVATATGRTLAAYRLADGTQRWRVPVAVWGESTWVEVAGDVPVVTGADPAGTDSDALMVQALDPGTGRVRWTRPGTPIVPAPQTQAQWLAVRRPLPGQDASRQPEAAEYTAVHIATGRTLWTFRTGLGEHVAFDRDWPWTGGPPAEYATTLSPDGRLVRHHLRSGAEVAAVGTAAVRPYTNHLQLAGGAVFLWHGPISLRRLAVYDAATLAHRWTAADLGTGGGVTDCGPVVCLSRDGPQARLDGIEPESGGVVWSMPCASVVADGTICRSSVLPLPSAGAVAVQMQPLGPGQETSSMLLDPANGTRLLDLRGWYPLWPAGAEPVFYRLEPVSERLDRPADPIRLGRLRTGPLGVESLGRVRAQWCDRSGTYLICAGAGVLVEVWRMR